MMIVPLSVEVSSLEPAGYNPRHVDVKLAPAEAAFLARLRNHLQESRPKGIREITIADAARHLIAVAALAQAEVQHAEAQAEALAQAEASATPSADFATPPEPLAIELPTAFPEIKNAGKKK